MTAVLTQNDVYSPAESNAFLKGYNEAVINRFDEAASSHVDKSVTVAEAIAYNEGYEFGSVTFEGTVFNIPAEV